MNIKPKLSIVIPAYNSEDNISQCLEAVFMSEFKDFEVLVIDDGSIDQTFECAQKYGARVIRFEKNMGRSFARNRGIQKAYADIVVCIDADILIERNSLFKIYKHFEKNSEIQAITGRLSAKHPNMDFFSQYKNLYMNYMFGLQPENVNFLFTSICALKRSGLVLEFDESFNYAEDTELGQRICDQGGTIHFLGDLEVVHLKKYTLMSFVKNDFLIPYHWAKIFIKYDGWKKFGKNRSGFAHASPTQLISLSILSAVYIFFLVNFILKINGLLFICTLFLWCILNSKFFSFLNEKKGLFFALRSILTTFIDQTIMLLGICCGLIHVIQQFVLKVKSRYIQEQPI